MKILFVRGHSPVSWLICKLTKEDVSHCAIEVDGWVLHSNFYGVHWETLADFEQKCTLMHELAVPEDPYHVIEMAALYSGRAQYDFGGLFYMGLRIFLRNYGIHLPKKNLWQQTGMFLCTEWVSQFLGGEEDSEITPFKLWEKLNASSLTGVPLSMRLLTP